MPNAARIHPVFRKSSFSGGNENCVECATNLPHSVAIRDSKDPSGRTLTFTTEAHSAFIAAVSDGEFDFGLL
ncbi:DUF397 domain-containing protein [Kitasatospora sp. NPDC002965]|uniref:DUF397 domain-containing protein n=1 Tax=Kitasatospora sp. NPDC002965 TaxID=3154775 RepID=UPI0033BDAE00